MKIKERKFKDGTRPNIYFYGESENGDKYSIVDFGELMKTSSAYEHLKQAGLFMGWEAIKILTGTGLDTDQQWRASSLENLLKQLPQ